MLREKLGIPEEHRLIVAFTSSLDERRGDTFSRTALDETRVMPDADTLNQLEWLKRSSSGLRPKRRIHLLLFAFIHD